MSARRLTPGRLRLECLEDRRLPSGLANATVFARVLESHPAAEALVAHYLAHDAALGADNRGAESDAADALRPAFALSAADAVRALQTVGNAPPGGAFGSPAPDHGTLASDSSAALISRLMYDSDIHQLEERLDGLVRDILASAATLGAPAVPSSSSSQSHFESESKYSIRLAPTAVQGAGPSARGNEDARSITALPNAPDLLASEYEARGDAIGFVAPSDGPAGGDEPRDLLPPAPSLDAIASSWCDAFSVPLTGSPIAAALPTNVHALDAAAQAFFESLAALAPEWPTESEECEYVWIVAGVLIAGGGGQIVRRVRNRVAASVERLPTTGAEGGE